MNGADTFDAAAILTGVVGMFWMLKQVIEGRASRKWRKVRRHRVVR
jgi:hypothetical protein